MVLKNLLVGQSGGPSAAINASLAGVLAEGIASEKIGKVYGAVNGISGVLADHIQEMDMMENEELLHLLKITPAMALGSCRHKLAEIDSDPESYQK